MDPIATELAESAREAATRIANLVAKAQDEKGRSASSTVFDEVQETILALIAAIVTADGATTDHELAFAKALTKNLETRERCQSYIDDYSNRWKRISRNPPLFVDVVRNYDSANGTRIARDIIDELRLLVRAAARVDGNAAPSEMSTADVLIARLECAIRRTDWTVKWDEDTRPAISLASSFNRDEFRNREIL